MATQQAKPFDHPEWLFEVKFDGFRSLAYIDDGNCELVSRKDATYSRFRELRERMTLEHSAILDGEIVCLDDQGRSLFYDLMFDRGEAHFSLSICSGSMVRTCVTVPWWNANPP